MKRVVGMPGGLVSVARVAAAVVFLGLASGCSKPSKEPAPDQNPAAPATAQATPAPDVPQEARDLALPEDMRAKLEQPFTGDFDQMVERRMIRVGVPFSRSFYFIDRGTPRGLVYEYLVLFEDALNKKLKKGDLAMHVVPVIMSRDQLYPALQSGRIDAVVAQLTITPERQKFVDFSVPTRTNVNEVVVTGPGAPPIGSSDDLAGKEVFVRKTSSYYQSLLDLNRKFAAAGKPPVNLRQVSESLEDDDLLEMVNAGLIPAIVVDNYLAQFWAKVFKDLTVHEDIALRTDGKLAVAFRKNSPGLAAELNEFVSRVGLDSAVGVTLNKRYLESTKYVRNAASETERKKFVALVQLFKKYGDQYQFDYLMMAAQGYQESRLDQSAKSAVGAIGVMQLMPETGKEQKVGDIRKLEPNVHAGVKYMRFIRSSFFEDQPMDDVNKALFTFAAYNAGPGRVRQLRTEAQERGLDPNVWLGNVERIASERIGRETVTYVSNIFKYYVAYKLIEAETERKKAAAASMK